MGEFSLNLLKCFLIKHFILKWLREIEKIAFHFGGKMGERTTKTLGIFKIPLIIS